MQSDCCLCIYSLAGSTDNKCGWAKVCESKGEIR